MSRQFNFFGANAEAYNSSEPKILLAGPAGTGKSLVLLAKCLTLLDKYPGCRGLFCRGTRASLTQSGLVTWEDEILGADNPVLSRKLDRRTRQSYKFPNKSEFVVCGLDDPGKTFSAKYDFVYIQEATEEKTDEHAYETLTRCFRGGVIVRDGVPWYQIMMDCNPTTPAHWIYQRYLRQELKMYESTHRDNPSLWDREKKAWTPEGIVYVQGTLKSMTGVRNARFYRGVWEAAEGAVYDFSPRLTTDTPPGHCLPRDWECPRNWKRLWSIDWGLSSPTCLQVWAIDPEGRMYLNREIYQPHQRADELGKWVRDKWLDLGLEPVPVDVICDVNPGRGAQISAVDAKGLFEKASGLHLRLADKEDRDRGVRETQAMFDRQSDGLPRIFFRKKALAHEPSGELLNKGLPTSTESELPGYVWDQRLKKDEPIDYNDHGMDPMRYAVRYVNTRLSGTGYVLPKGEPILPDRYRGPR